MSLSWLVVLQEEDLQEHGELQGPHDERLRPRNPALTPLRESRASRRQAAGRMVVCMGAQDENDIRLDTQEGFRRGEASVQMEAEVCAAGGSIMPVGVAAVRGRGAPILASS